MDVRRCTLQTKMNLHKTLLLVLVCVNLTYCTSKTSYWTASLNRLNVLRGIHRGGPVNDTTLLNNLAQSWADTMAEHSLWQHSSTWFGENIAGGWSASQEVFDEEDKNRHVLAAVDMWYSEIEFYDFGKPGWSPNTGHFTALVWAATNEVGIGVAFNPITKRVYVVMNFNPPGNYPKKFMENVFAPVVVKPVKGFKPPTTPSPPRKRAPVPYRRMHPPPSRI